MRGMGGGGARRCRSEIEDRWKPATRRSTETNHESGHHSCPISSLINHEFFLNVCNREDRPWRNPQSAASVFHEDPLPTRTLWTLFPPLLTRVRGSMEGEERVPVEDELAGCFVSLKNQLQVTKMAFPMTIQATSSPKRLPLSSLPPIIHLPPSPSIFVVYGI